MTDTAYVFEGTRDDLELGRLRLLESVFDPGTIRTLLAVGIRAGMRCLEIGAGAGSVATWMSEVVGATGRVSAVDISTRFLSSAKGANVEVHEADIRTVDLKPASFDVAHARFVFIHLSDWRTALAATLRLLKPGGVLVLEEPDFSASRALAGATATRQSFDRAHHAIKEMFTARNMDYAFGLRLPEIFAEHQLENVAVENDAPIVQGDAPFARMMGMSTRQLRDKYLATRVATADDIENYARFSSDRACWAIYHGTIRAAGRKPSSASAGQLSNTTLQQPAGRARGS